MSISNLREFHPVANIFPLMQGDEYEQLKADIKANGLLEPIWLDSEGKIIDGRNRYRACVDSGVEPQYKTWQGNDLLSFIISMNLHRRHLSESQRAVVASKLANMPAHRIDNKSANLRTSVSQSQAAEMLNVSERIVSTIKAIEKAAPELIEKIESGEITAHKATKEVKRRDTESRRNEVAIAGEALQPTERWCVEVANINTYTTDKRFDFIITDPPYTKEYLPLYEVLAKRAKEWLKPTGLIIVMCGQSYLDQIYAILSKHLVYYWTSCYLTPKQPTPMRQRQVNTTWKPLLIYSPTADYTGKIFGDVFTSPNPEKDNHDWGQSVEGMLDIISQICLSGQSILDPFCGAGATGVAALRHGCLFHGIDIDEQSVNISKSRLAEVG